MDEFTTLDAGASAESHPSTGHEVDAPTMNVTKMNITDGSAGGARNPLNAVRPPSQTDETVEDTTAATEAAATETVPQPMPALGSLPSTDSAVATTSSASGAEAPDLDARSLPPLPGVPPGAPLVEFGNLPTALPDGRHYVLWRYEWNGKKFTKVPYRTQGGKANVTDPAHCATLPEVRAVYEAGRAGGEGGGRPDFDGIGLVLTRELGIVALDLDHQIEAGGALTDAARAVVGSLGSYTEISPGGTGLRILALGTLTEAGSRHGNFEIYDHARYVTLTGRRLEGAPATIESRQTEIDAFHGQYIREPKRSRPGGHAGRPAVATTPGAPLLSNAQVLEKAGRGASGPKFSDLFAKGMNSSFAKGGKEGNSGGRSQSELDLFVCGVLARYTGRDAGRMDELFRTSALMRPKWDERRSGDGRSYGQLTVDKAIEGCDKVYDPLEPDFPVWEVDDIPKSLGKNRQNAPAYGARQILHLLYPHWQVEALDTEAAHAQRTAHYLGDELCHVDGLGWLRFDGRRFVPDNREKKRTLARVAQLSKYVRAEATRLYELTALLSAAGRDGDAAAMGDAAKSVSALTRTVEGKRFISESLELAAGRPELTRNAKSFELRAWRIPFENGVWDHGKWRAHEREDCFLELCPIAIDPQRLADLNAQSEDAGEEVGSDAGSGDAGIGDEGDAMTPWEGTEWGSLLERIVGGDRALARTLQEVCGYALSAASYLRLVLWAYGDKGTGKSTITELLQTVLGNGAIQVSPEKLSSRGDRERLGAQLASMRLGVCAEAGNKQIDAELLKTYSGSDTITARRLYHEPISVSPHQVLFLVSNHPPRLDANDAALRERILVLPFTHSLKEGGWLPLSGGRHVELVRRDANSLLVREFALWALQGARRVLATGRVFRAPVVEAAIQRFWGDTDLMKRFWETVPLEKLHRGLFASDLRTLYHLWCEGMQILPVYRLGPKLLNQACENIGLQEVRLTRDNVRSWKLPPDPNRQCSRQVRRPEKNQDVIVSLNIFGEEVVRGDAGGHPVFQEAYYKAEDFVVGGLLDLDALLNETSSLERPSSTETEGSSPLEPCAPDIEPDVEP